VGAINSNSLVWVRSTQTAYFNNKQEEEFTQIMKFKKKQMKFCIWKAGWPLWQVE
jgi:hypothetical protein